MNISCCSCSFMLFYLGRFILFSWKRVFNVSIFFSGWWKHNYYDDEYPASLRIQCQPISRRKQVHWQAKGQIEHLGPMWLQHPPLELVHRMPTLFEILFPRFPIERSQPTNRFVRKLRWNRFDPVPPHWPRGPGERRRVFSLELVKSGRPSFGLGQ